jgi:peptidoglycan biosynthesis protein MviN/MurJ (putative lipid II flippase)
MVRNMIKKILNKNLQYNLLSLINVFMGFAFIVFLGRKFGASSQTDIYFLSIVIISYLGYFIQSVWEAMSPYYIEKKVQDKELSDKLYSILLNDLILVSLAIIVLYFVVTSLFDVISFQTKEFLDIFIFYILFQNILLLNKTVLNLEHFYVSFYIVDIFVYIILFITIFFLVDTEFVYIAYGTILATFIANVWQFYLIFKQLEINYTLKLYSSDLKEIYLNSFKLKIGSLFYGSKDIIIASVFSSFGTGTYSLYSYANKFAGVILQVVNAPIVNIFATKANYYVANKEYHLLRIDIKKVLIQTTLLFTASAVVTYFILPFILSILFGDKFTDEDILNIQSLFMIMIVFYFVVVIESPFARLINIFKLFNFGILINVVFGIILFVAYFISTYFDLNYITFLYIVIFAQISNLTFAYMRYKYFLKEQNEI